MKSLTGRAKPLGVLIVALLLAGNAKESVSSERRVSEETRRSSSAQRVNPRDAERLERVMVPLLRATDKARNLKEVRVGIIADPNINAANAGGGEFYVTTGLLEKANDEQLRGVLAHEIAHDDLGHVARAQILGVGLNLGVVLLEQLIPGSSAITPIAGSLVARSHSRSEELAADRHGRGDFASRRLLQNSAGQRANLADANVGGKRRRFFVHPPGDCGAHRRVTKIGVAQNEDNGTTGWAA